MAHIELDITSDTPCTYRTRKGVYFSTLHWWGRKPEHDRIQLGPYDPSRTPIGQLVAALLSRTPQGREVMACKTTRPFEGLIGLSIVRACMHPVRTEEKLPSLELRGERVSSIFFVKDAKGHVPVEETPDAPSALSRFDVGKVKVVSDGSAKHFPAQFLPWTPVEQISNPVTHAIETLATAGLHRDIRGALRARGENGFIETRVTEEELMDTLR